MIPTREQCLDLIRRHEMLPHIVRHSELVTDVALLIARKLNSCGEHLDLALVVHPAYICKLGYIF